MSLDVALLALLAVVQTAVLIGICSYRSGRRRGKAAGVRYAVETFGRERAEEDRQKALDQLKRVETKTAMAAHFVDRELAR